LPKDNNWMSYLNPDLRLNLINIPGTHDSGTYAIEKTGNFFYDNFLGIGEVIRKASSRTQLLDITQ